jgi:hypothetical protein
MRADQKLRKHLVTRRGKPAGAVASIERRDPAMNRIGITRSRPEHNLAFDKGHAKVVRETAIEETLLDCSACKQSGLRRNGLLACVLGRRDQKHQIDVIGGEKSEGGDARLGISRMGDRCRMERRAGTCPRGRGYNPAGSTQIHWSKPAKGHFEFSRLE